MNEEGQDTDSYLTSFWKNYNSEKSWVPFAVPFSFFFCCFLYSKKQGFEFTKWSGLHFFHNLIAVCIASISIYFNDNSIFNERISILWSISYFIIDGSDCLLTGNVDFALHGVLALFLGCCNYQRPLLRQLRMNSKAHFCEISTLVLPFAKKTRNPIIFGIFGLLFTLCRVIWIPIMFKELYDNGMEIYDISIIVLAVFYCLNLYWWYKIIMICLNGGESEKKKSEKKDE